MKNRHSIVVTAAIVFLLSSCTAFNYGVTIGAIPNTNPAKEYSQFYGFYKGGFLFHKHSTVGQLGNAAATKTGTGACSRSILGLIAFGDSSIDAAKKTAGITKVATVEYETLGVLATIYHQQCTIVTGE